MNVTDFGDLEFAQEDVPSLAIGVNDAQVRWYSSQPTNSRGTVATGLYTPCGYEDLDSAIEAYNAEHPQNAFQRLTVSHEKGEPTEDWLFPDKGISFFVLCKGYKPKAPDLAERGIVFSWVPRNNDPDKNITILKVRAVIADLLSYGYEQPVQLRAAGQARTQGLESVLLEHQRTLEAFKRLKGVAVPYYTFSLPIGVSSQSQKVGKIAQKSMYVPVALIPGKVTKEFLLQHYVKNAFGGDDVLPAYLSDMLHDSIQWAKDMTHDLKHGKKQEEEPLIPASDDMPALDSDWETSEDVPAPQKRGDLVDGIKDYQPASQEQRNGLRKLGMRLQRPELVELSEKEKLTFREASQAIVAAQKPATGK